MFAVSPMSFDKSICNMQLESIYKPSQDNAVDMNLYSSA